jgi:hypothetical protein
MKGYARIRFIILVATLILAFGVPMPAHAQGLVYGDTIPAGTVLDYDVILIGQNVSIEGTVNGNVFILGNQVTINGEVNGSLVMIGQNILVGGTVTGGTYAVGLTLELGSGAALGRDLYVLSVGLASGRDSAVGRDLNALGLDAGLSGTVGRDLHTSIGPIQLYNGLMSLLGFEELKLKLHFELPPPAAEPATTPTGWHSPFAFRARMLRAQTLQEKPFDWTAWAVTVVREWAVLLLFGLLAFWLLRPRLVASGRPLLEHPWRTTGIGLLAFVLSILLFLLAILLGAMVFSIGLALNYVGLWQLSIALWIAVYSCLALALTALWFFIVYGTKIIFVHTLFDWISVKISPALWLKILAFVLGLLFFVLLRSVPMVGWVIGVLVTAAGLGTAWLTYRPAPAASIADKPQPGIQKTKRVKV